jgi:hypothetical protein
VNTIHIDELPERCRRDICAYFEHHAPDHWIILAKKEKSIRGYPVWQVSFLKNEDFEQFKKFHHSNGFKIVNMSNYAAEA